MRWLAGLHDRFAGIEGGRLTRYDESYFDAADGNVPAYRLAATRLAALPRTLVHGDLYASNVLVADGRVCALDWELAGTGPGVLDVAALTMGWPEEERLALAESYRLALASPPARDDFLRDLDSAALHLAVRWLGSAGDWSPPPEHLQDWPAEVERLAARMAT
jgi:aminoglycoside phosphotransferase (APT) family kinase protein